MATTRPSRLIKVSAEEFVRRLKDEVDQPDVHYAFWLGAGCSISSGIPRASALVKDHWLPKLGSLRHVDPGDLDDWARRTFGYDPDDPGAVYGPVMEALFIQPEARQREVERLCAGAKPGFGYAVLSSLLSREDGLFNVALTTNFDDLIADAMYVFGPDESRPLVIYDEVLARFIRPMRMRPLVVKVHGDFRLSPRNTKTETDALKKEISDGIGELLHDRGAIFVGYGGEDRGIAEVFKALPSEALPHGIWWASRREPSGVLRDWLEDRRAVWVEVPGFDELMLLFKSEFGIPNPNPLKFNQLFESYVKTYKGLQVAVERIPASNPSAGPLRSAVVRADSLSTDWTSDFFAASRLQQQDPAAAERIYRDGIAQFPQAALLRAGFSVLLRHQSRYKEALELARAAYKLEPNNGWVTETLGAALATSGHLNDAIDTLKVGAREDPNNVRLRSRLGCYLALAGRSVEAGAELQAIKALGMARVDDIGLYPTLMAELGLHEEAAEVYEKALEAGPNLAHVRLNFVRTLIALGRRGEALAQLDLAISALTPATVVDGLETYFYRWAVARETVKSKALTEVKRRLLEGVRLPNWGMADVVRFVGTVDDQEVAWAEVLARVIGGEARPTELDSWPRWRAA